MPTFRNGCNRVCETSINEKNIINLDEYDECKLLNFLKEKKLFIVYKKTS